MPSGVHGYIPPCIVEGCARPNKARGFCNLHYHRFAATGDPLATRKTPNGGFLALLKQAARAATDECIVASTFSGRPVAKLNGKSMNASRAVWILANGDPGRLHVLHTCHNDRCISIKHLYTGDHDRNMRDMSEAGRWGTRALPVGADHGRAVLIEANVLDIRRRAADGESAAALAREFKVHRRTVEKVIKGETWKHLD
ncbi:hypothetical protein RVR_4512 [Actinacidiphila reveromycinica]|uniref:HNH endonuclease n=1 Tax=Actinacidiphila reveromycinica TaxID=659352 RepID=A0A7U3VP90_9ACTN|nr:hypothetical protein [Streptomyces sp. SN-593]BBA98359.1 hypothetical protein RVR_4512 [Streptomyces sp. SN-593]